LLVPGDFSGSRNLAGFSSSLVSATESAVLLRGCLGFSCAASGEWFSAVFFCFSGSGALVGFQWLLPSVLLLLGL